jgi:Ca2+-transporting ATPase
LAAYVWALTSYGPGQEATTVAFVVLAVIQLTQALNCRSEDLSVFELGLVSNRHGISATVMVMLSLLLAIYAPPLQSVLKTTNLTVVDWFVITLASLVPVALVEAFKYLKTRAGVPAG